SGITRMARRPSTYGCVDYQLLKTGERMNFPIRIVFLSYRAAKLWTGLVVLMVLLAACGAQETAIPPPTARPTRTAVPAAAVPTLTPIPAATATPAAAATRAPSPTAETLAQCPLSGFTDTAQPWLARRPLL